MCLILDISYVLNTSAQTGNTGSCELQYFVLFCKTLDQCIDLTVITGELHDQVLGTDINDLRTEIVGKEFYLLESGQSLMSGCIQYGEIFLLILSIKKDILELVAIVLVHFIRNLHGFLTNIGIQNRTKGGEIFSKKIL